MTLDATQQAEEADRRAREAKAALAMPALREAFIKLEQHYISMFRNSEPLQPELREEAFHMLRALDAMRGNLTAAMSGAAITRRNLRSQLELRER